ncbi:hypothetical protein, partial [Streptomyces sp. NPDC048489]|uniref:hypothetical protein n=1 Tax=Streptomyces sp. NPDC048489 TaxID=3154504 RepID=UPI00344AFEAD
SVDRDMGGSNFGFPTGSTFKPFVAAAALEQGREAGPAARPGPLPLPGARAPVPGGLPRTLREGKPRG